MPMLAMPMLAHRRLLFGLIALIFKQLRINGTEKLIDILNKYSCSYSTVHERERERERERESIPS